MAIAVSFASCGTSIGKIPMERVGETREVKLPLDEGMRLLVAVYVEKESHDAQNYLVLDFELRRDKKVVATKSCRGFDFDGAGGSCGAKHYNDDCEIEVPQGGATSLLARTHLENQGAVSVEGLELDVRRQ